MIRDYLNVEKTSFRTFLIFTLVLLLLLLPSYVLFSEKFLVQSVELDSEIEIDNSLIVNLYGQSIFTIRQNSIEMIYSRYPIVEKIEIDAQLPDTVLIIVETYPPIAEITDFRGSQPKVNTLYKNLSTTNSSVLEKNTLRVSITNGPVDEGFHGELVSLYMTLSDLPGIELHNFSITHSGTSITAEYLETVVLFGAPFDLGTKAATIGELLNAGTCVGKVTFVSEKSFITQCEI